MSVSVHDTRPMSDHDETMGGVCVCVRAYVRVCMCMRACVCVCVCLYFRTSYSNKITMNTVLMKYK